MKTIAWQVFGPKQIASGCPRCGAPYETKRNVHIDTVYFDADLSAEDVRRSLIEHDCYDPRITVHKEGTQ